MNANDPSQPGTPSQSGVPPADGNAAGGLPPLVPDYELLRRIGHGAYGDVWLARSKATGALRAAKIVWRRSFEDNRPFQREFEGIQRFERISREHPSQLSLFHIGRNEAAGYFYYVMELADDAVEGKNEERRMKMEASARSAQSVSSFSLQPSAFERYVPHTLRADLEQGRLPAARVLEIGLALTEALSHLHSNGLVHRDVKPSNVIFVNGRPKLADIGLVTDASDQCSIVGTEGYLPPEGPGTPQADIFALGKVLYEALTGLDRRQFPELPEEFHAWPDAALAFELNEVILKACESDSRQRYQNAEQMRADLELLQRGQSVKRQRSLKKFWAVSMKVGIALVILAIVLAVVVIMQRQLTPSDISSDGPPSTNFEANALCDKAIYILRGDNFAEFAAAYTNFNQAIARDPNFARPYVGLLELRVPEHVSGLPYQTLDEMRTIARELERLAPRLAATYCARSVVDWGEWNFAQAERDGLASIRADPNYAFGHIWYGWMLLCFGRAEEARKQGDINLIVAPSKVTTYRFLGNLHYLERNYTNAMTWYRKALKMEKHHIISYEMIALCLQVSGDYTNALEYDYQANILKGDSEATAKGGHELLRRALDEGGLRGYWAQQWDWAETNTNSGLYWKAVIQFNLGNTNAALDLLDESYAKRQLDGFDPSLSYVLIDHWWDGLHDNPRFKELLDKIGFTKVMPPRKK